jgi:ABC-type branched-subunit amino acid transport system ATPase component
MTHLRVVDIRKTFGGLVAVNGVSLVADRQKVTALIGPNGAGKTTLFNVISGFEPADTGQIEFDGRGLERLPAFKRARLGMVRTFQTPVGFPRLTVWENLLVGGMSERSESISRAMAGPRAWRSDLRDCQHEARELLLKLGLWEAREARVEDLSPGDSKLIEFARQLMTRPKMMLLDEPASGVNPGQIERLAEFIRELAAMGISIVIIDHNLSFVLGIADYVYVLSDGRIIAAGSPDAIAQDPIVIETYVGKSREPA